MCPPLRIPFLVELRYCGSEPRLPKQSNKVEEAWVPPNSRGALPSQPRVHMLRQDLQEKYTHILFESLLFWSLLWQWNPSVNYYGKCQGLSEHEQD